MGGGRVKYVHAFDRSTRSASNHKSTMFTSTHSYQWDKNISTCLFVSMIWWRKRKTDCLTCKMSSSTLNQPCHQGRMKEIFDNQRENRSIDRIFRTSITSLGFEWLSELSWFSQFTLCHCWYRQFSFSNREYSSIWSINRIWLANTFSSGSNELAFGILRRISWKLMTSLYLGLPDCLSQSVYSNRILSRKEIVKYWIRKESTHLPMD